MEGESIYSPHLLIRTQMSYTDEIPELKLNHRQPRALDYSQGRKTLRKTAALKTLDLMKGIRGKQTTQELQMSSSSKHWLTVMFSWVGGVKGSGG